MNQPVQLQHFKKNGSPPEVRVTQQQYVALGDIALLVGVTLAMRDRHQQLGHKKFVEHLETMLRKLGEYQAEFIRDAQSAIVIPDLTPVIVGK